MTIHGKRGSIGDAQDIHENIESSIGRRCRIINHSESLRTVAHRLDDDDEEQPYEIATSSAGSSGGVVVELLYISSICCTVTVHDDSGPRSERLQLILVITESVATEFPLLRKSLTVRIHVSVDAQMGRLEWP